MRQTNLSLEKILELIKTKGHGGYPDCMLVNEIGIICQEEKTEASEQALLSLLDSENPGYRAISFCFLLTDKELGTKHLEVLSEFKLKPENEKLMPDIGRMLIQFENS